MERADAVATSSGSSGEKDELEGTYWNVVVNTEHHGLLASSVVFNTIDFPGAKLGTDVLGINSRGSMVGDYFDTDMNHSHGFVAANGAFQSIDFPQATATTAISINDAGEIVGAYINTLGDRHGFLLSHGVFTSIDFPGAALTVAREINDSGDIAGFYLDSAGRSHGFVLNNSAFSTIDAAPPRAVVTPTAVVTTPTTAPVPAATPTTTPTPTFTPTPTPTPAPAMTTATVVAAAMPTPPSNAQVFTALEEMTGWKSCNGSNCAGGSGTGTYWFAQNQTTPARDGSSMELYNSGIGADSLWWQKLGAHSSATNFLWDFYAQVDEASVAAAQALEYDSFQFVGGYNYMFGSQCNLAAGKWDLWDELHGQWVHSSIPCKEFAPNVWHHIQWYVQRIAGTQNYTFVTLVVDGTAYSVNQTFSANYVGWADNVGVQYQLDVNATGAGYHEWVDQSTLTIW